jgi:hypothetical protein
MISKLLGPVVSCVCFLLSIALGVLFQQESPAVPLQIPANPGVNMYVAPDATKGNCTWENPCGLQESVDRMVLEKDGGTIWMKPGRYEYDLNKTLVLPDRKQKGTVLITSVPGKGVVLSQ